MGFLPLETFGKKKKELKMSFRKRLEMLKKLKYAPKKALCP